MVTASTARPKALIAWSSGKDSAWALHEARRAGRYDIVGALTTVTDTFSRVSMHGVREELLYAQLDAVGLPATFHLPDRAACHRARGVRPGTPPARFRLALPPRQCRRRLAGFQFPR